MSTTGIPAQLGRRRITSRAELEHVAFELFDRQGFEGTTIDDIAVAAGIGRRTFFRYFPSKNDIPWGAFETELDRMRAWLAACPPQWPLMDAIRLAIVDFNQVPPADERWHRRRMQLILGVPVLQAHSTLRYAEWRQVIADFVAERTGAPAGAYARPGQMRSSGSTSSRTKASAGPLPWPRSCARRSRTYAASPTARCPCSASPSRCSKRSGSTRSWACIQTS